MSELQESQKSCILSDFQIVAFKPHKKGTVSRDFYHSVFSSICSFLSQQRYPRQISYFDKLTRSYNPLKFDSQVMQAPGSQSEGFIILQCNLSNMNFISRGRQFNKLNNINCLNHLKIREITKTTTCLCRHWGGFQGVNFHPLENSPVFVPPES